LVFAAQSLKFPVPNSEAGAENLKFRALILNVAVLISEDTPLKRKDKALRKNGEPLRLTMVFHLPVIHRWPTGSCCREFATVAVSLLSVKKHLDEIT